MIVGRLAPAGGPCGGTLGWAAAAASSKSGSPSKLSTLRPGGKEHASVQIDFPTQKKVPPDVKTTKQPVTSLFAHRWLELFKQRHRTPNFDHFAQLQYEKKRSVPVFLFADVQLRQIASIWRPHYPNLQPVSHELAKDELLSRNDLKKQTSREHGSVEKRFKPFHFLSVSWRSKAEEWGKAELSWAQSAFFHCSIKIHFSSSIFFERQSNWLRHWFSTKYSDWWRCLSSFDFKTQKYLLQKFLTV